MNRRPGLSARLKLTISYAGFLLLAGALLLAVVWVFLLRYVPDRAGVPGANRSDLLRASPPPRPQYWPSSSCSASWEDGSSPAGCSHPLTRIADAARMAANGSLSHRIRMEGPKDEFRELADVFDTMLEQLESHVIEQQRFAANASHELRTPLAISQTLLDLARNDPTPDQCELIERLHTVNTRAIDLTEGLLLLSRGDRRAFIREPIDLSLIAEEATETLLPIAEQRRITLDVTGQTTQTVGSAALLLRMVTNLVQNAIVHNLPAGGTVTVHTESQNDASVLQVENTGHPLPLELVPTLTEPFQRGTERIRTDEHAGVGLGLAIVHSIVQAHDGTLDLTPRPAGGLLVTIRLPGTPQASSPDP
jgi:two-component system sensor histidine kinase VanS